MDLPVKYRVVVMLRDIEQLSTDEVARQLGLTVPTVKVRLLRGRLMLREWLSPHFTTSLRRAAQMITCEEFLAEFGDYIENQVSPEVRKELELHLSQCRACHVLYDSSCKTIKIVTESSAFELPQSVSDPIINRVMARLRKERS